MEKLFTNYNEFTDFTNALAYRRIKNLEKTDKKFNEEIAETIDECGKIFKQNGSDINYIEEIIDLEMQMQNNESKGSNSVDLEELSLKRESLYNKYNSFLEKLPLDIKEDLEFYFKKVFDRKLRSNHTTDLTNQIKIEFPKAEELTTTEIMEQPIFAEINNFLDKDIKVDKAEEVIEETQNLPYVTQIKKASDDLLNEKIVENEVEEKEETQELNKFPKLEEANLEIPNLFLDNNDLKLEDSNMPSFDEIPEQETDKIEIKEEKEEPVIENDNQDDIFTAFNDLPLIDEPIKKEQVQEEPVMEKEIPNDEEQLTYTMESGDTLTSLAIAMCDDENGWYDIFEANKEVLEERLKEAGLSKNDPFENNEEVFVGLTLNIPNVYEKTNQKMRLAA